MSDSLRDAVAEAIKRSAHEQLKLPDRGMPDPVDFCQLADAALDAARTHRMDVEVEVTERRDAPGTWGVEAINQKGDGEVYMAIFSGPLAKVRAREYAQMKYGIRKATK